MERTKKTAVPSLKDNTKENNQTQSYDILDPNVFQNISKCFPKLPAEAFTASGYGCSPCHYLSAASQRVTAHTEEMVGDDFSNDTPAKTHPRPFCRKHGVLNKNCLFFLNGASSNVMELNCHVGFWEQSISECTWPDVLTFTAGFLVYSKYLRTSLICL